MGKYQTNWKDNISRREWSMDITEFFLLTAFLVIVIELFCNGWWITVYFRNGIPIFRKYIEFIEGTSISTEELSGELCIFFPARTFNNITNNDIAFREVWFLRPWISIMRGLIHIDNKERKITVIGYINWNVFCIFFFPLNILADPGNRTHIFDMLRLFGLAVIIIFVVLKFKYKVYEKIFNYLKNRYS